jgi:hypothetical protein
MPCSSDLMLAALSACQPHPNPRLRQSSRRPDQVRQSAAGEQVQPRGLRILEDSPRGDRRPGTKRQVLKRDRHPARRRGQTGALPGARAATSPRRSRLTPPSADCLTVSAASAGQVLRPESQAHADGRGESGAEPDHDQWWPEQQRQPERQSQPERQNQHGSGPPRLVHPVIAGYDGSTRHAVPSPMPQVWRSA